MKRFMFLVLLLSLVAGGSLAQAGENKQSWFLMENGGEVMAVEAQSQTVVNVTTDLEENATIPMWSADGMFISFIIVDEVLTRNEVPYGIAAWVDFDDENFEVNTVTRCENGDVLCTNASIVGDWMVFTAVRIADDYPILYAYNIADGDLEVLQSGGFETLYVSNRWEGDNYVAVGKFGGNRQIARIYDVPGPGFETSNSTLMAPLPQLGCNLENLAQEMRGGKYYVDLRFADTSPFDFIEFEGIGAFGRMWRNCRAEQPDF